MKREYPCIVVDLKKIKNNVRNVVQLCKNKNISLVGVSKVFCAKKPIVKAMLNAGVEAIGDSRLENLIRIKDIQCKKVLLRIPMESKAKDVVKYSDISLNSEIETIKKLSQAAKEENRIHNIILMVDVGDLREGILEEDVLNSVFQILNLENIKLIGIGTNLTCYGGVLPDEQNLGRLINLKNSIEEKCGINLDIVSGGNSSTLYMVINDTIPKGINQLRIGEAIVLGRETAFGENIEGSYNDCFILKGEIIEIKDKPSVPRGRIGKDAFGGNPCFEDKGVIKRAIIALGRQDVNIDELCALDKDINILGGSSDHLILDVSKSKKNYCIGDIIDFSMNYGCLLRAMTSPYVKKYYIH